MTEKQKRKRYTDEFKAEAVRLVEQRGDRTVAEIAQSLGIAENMLHAWKRQHEPNLSNDRGESPEQELQPPSQPRSTVVLARPLAG